MHERVQSISVYYLTTLSCWIGGKNQQMVSNVFAVDQAAQVYDIYLKVQSCKLKKHWMITYVFQKYPENFTFQLIIIFQ